jgi:hypothetical protein
LPDWWSQYFPSPNNNGDQASGDYSNNGGYEDGSSTKDDGNYGIALGEPHPSSPSYPLPPSYLSPLSYLEDHEHPR